MVRSIFLTFPQWIPGSRSHMLLLLSHPLAAAEKIEMFVIFPLISMTPRGMEGSDQHKKHANYKHMRAKMRQGKWHYLWFTSVSL